MRHESVVGIAQEVQVFFDSLGNYDRVLAISIVPLSDVPEDDRADYLEEYPECTHLVRVVECVVEEDDCGGVAYPSNIMGQEIPALVYEYGHMTLLEDLDEEYGSGPDLQDVCVNRALEWMGRNGATITDIHPHWREWPSTDHWADRYGKDMSSNV